MDASRFVLREVAKKVVFGNLMAASYPWGFGRLCFFFPRFVGFGRFVAAKLQNPGTEFGKIQSI